MRERARICSTCDEAVADISDGATVMVGGFGPMGGRPVGLIDAVRRRGSRRLTVIANGIGGRSTSLVVWAENQQIAKLVCSFPAATTGPTAFEEQYLRGEAEIELVPQGTLAERIRAGGAGIAAFYTPTGVGTVVEEGKEKRWFNGRPYLLEHALRADFALIKAYQADELGNLTYRGTSRNFNPHMATAADVTIAEVEELVPVGGLDPERIGTPCIYVDRVVVVPRGWQPKVEFNRQHGLAG